MGVVPCVAAFERLHTQGGGTGKLVWLRARALTQPTRPYACTASHTKGAPCNSSMARLARLFPVSHRP